MIPLDLDRLLASVGKGVFVRYFEKFQDLGVPNGEVAALLPQEYTLNSRRSRTSTARRIIRQGLYRKALERIASSDRLDRDLRSEARLLLEQLAPS